jgi:hypothetical protein
MGQIMIKFHWKYINEDENKWMMPIVFDKGIPMKYTKKPSQDIIDKIEAMFKFMKGTRNFILIVSNRTAYVNSFFYYFGLTWLTTTNKVFDIVDLGLIKEDPKLYTILEHSNLLMVPHVNPDTYTLRDVRDRIGSILIKRQVRNLPTIIELYSRKPAKEISNKDLINLLQSLSSIYGESCAGTFMDKASNVKVVKFK